MRISCETELYRNLSDPLLSPSHGYIKTEWNNPFSSIKKFIEKRFYLINFHAQTFVIGRVRILKHTVIHQTSVILIRRPSKITLINYDKNSA